MHVTSKGNIQVFELVKVILIFYILKIFRKYLVFIYID